MKTASRAQSRNSPPLVQMRHYTPRGYPFLFPSVISSLPQLPPPSPQRLQVQQPSSSGSTPSPLGELFLLLTLCKWITDRLTTIIYACMDQFCLCSSCRCLSGILGVWMLDKMPWLTSYSSHLWITCLSLFPDKRKKEGKIMVYLIQHILHDAYGSIVSMKGVHIQYLGV